MEGIGTGSAHSTPTLGRVLLFYAIGAVLALQLVHLAITYLALPNWLGTIGFFVAFAGLPVVLVGWLIQRRAEPPR